MMWWLLIVGKNGAARELYQTTRWLRQLVLIGGTPIHIVYLYNEAGNDVLIRSRNNRNCQYAFEDAESFGDQAAFLCVGSNTTTTQSSMLSAALATGRWHDIGAIYGSEPTYGQDPSWDKFSP
eukprot:2739112-Pyramimonas_sp.AAC.1